jgi:acyl carrier protein
VSDSEIRSKVQDVFREVFDDPGLDLRDDMTAEDIEDWTSLTHINLIVALEKALGVKFATAEISKMKEPGEDVGSLLRMIEARVC